MKKLLIVLGAVIALLIVAWFVLTSSAFVKAVLLPRVARALNAQITVGDVALRPFSQVELRKLTLTPNGAQELASAELARVRYRLSSLLRGNIAFDEVHLESPIVTVVRKPDGSSNLDPILKQISARGTGADAKKPGSAKPIPLDLKSIRIENGTIRYQAESGDSSQLAAELTDLDVTAQNIKSGSTGRIELGTALKLDQRPAGAGATPSGAQGTVKGAFDFALTPELMPASVAGNTRVQLDQTTGALKDFQGFAALLDADLTPSELKRAALEFSRQGTPLGSITAKGPLDLTRKEAKLEVNVASIDRNVLNLLGAANGLDFTTTRFDSSNRIEVAAGGRKVKIDGGVIGSKVAVKKGELTMPPMDLKKTFDLAVDLAAKSVAIRAFSLTGIQGGREVLSGKLSEPMQITWGDPNAAAPDATADLQVTDLRLADWSALAGTPLQGSISAHGKLGVRGGGKDLAFDLNAALAGISGRFGTNELRNLGATLTATGALAGLADPTRRRLTAKAKVSELSGSASAVQFDRFGADVDAEIDLPTNMIAINRLVATITDAGRPSGSAAVTGRWNRVEEKGDIEARLTDFTEGAVRPFLQPALGDKQLRSVKLAANLSATIDPTRDSAIKATADVRDLVVRDPAHKVPESPLAAGIILDAGGSKQKLTLRQAELKLSPTARAKNHLICTGNLDFARTNALRGALKLAAESIDITPYFDLFAGAPKSTNQPAASPPPRPSGPQKEPDPIQLPIDSLDVEASIGMFYLCECAAENVLASVKINGSRVEANPIKFSLKGAPVEATAKLNLGVPGFEYDLHLSADGVPIKPMVDSFVPMLKERMAGNLKAGLDVQGKGITGVNLQKHLAGAASLSITNANLKLIESGKRRGVLSILTTLLATALNIRELKEAPIMDLNGQLKMGDGKFDLSEARVRSHSFEATTSGTIPIAPDLMQSPLNLPVQLALSRPLAERARLVPANTPTNATYVPIPEIAAIRGSLGAPDPRVDKVSTAALAARGLAGLLGGEAGGILGNAANVVEGLGSIATGKGGTNAVGNLIEGIGGLLGGKRAGTNVAKPTNAPGTAAAPATNTAPSSPLDSLLKGLLDKKKK